MFRDMGLNDTIKIISVVSSVLVLFCGLALTVKAGTFRDAWKTNMNYLDKQTAQYTTVGTVIGILIVFVTVFGITSIIFGGYVIVVIYVVFLINLAISLIFFELVLVREYQAESSLDSILNNFSSFKENEIYSIQERFQCCGINKYTDYLDSSKLWRKPKTTKKQIFTSTRKSIVKDLKEMFRFKRSNELKDSNVSFKLSRSDNIVLSDGVVVGGYSDVLNSFIEAVWPEIYRSSKSLGLDKKFESSSIIKDWLGALVGYMYVWNEWKKNPTNLSLHWWYGSGWDFILFKQLSRNSEGILPSSCCVKKKKKCYGFMNDTYQEGCREKLTMFWRYNMAQFGFIIICFIIIVICHLPALFIHIDLIKGKKI